MDKTVKITADIDNLNRILFGADRLLDGLTTTVPQKTEKIVLKNSGAWINDYYKIVSGATELLSGSIGIIADAINNLEIEFTEGGDQ